MNPLDLGRIERRAWQSYHADGLMDIAFGVLLLCVFLGSSAERFHWGAIVALLLVGPALAVAKRLVTAPRLGTVQFGEGRRSRKRRAVLVIALLVSATALLPIVVGGDAWLHEHVVFVSIALGIWVFAAFAAIAYWLQLARMYAVGLLFGGAFTATELLDTPLPLLVAGIVVALSGVARLVGFVRRYPKPTDTGDTD